MKQEREPQREAVRHKPEGETGGTKGRDGRISRAEPFTVTAAGCSQREAVLSFGDTQQCLEPPVTVMTWSSRDSGHPESRDAVQRPTSYRTVPHPPATVDASSAEAW